MRVLLTVVLAVLMAESVSTFEFTIGFIATTFDVVQKQFVRNAEGAQHLAAFMMAVDEINNSNDLDIRLRPEVSLGNIDYISSIIDKSYDGAAAARDIFLSDYLPQAVIIADSGDKARSAGEVLQSLGVPSLYTKERGSQLSHPSIVSESFRMTPSEAQDGAVIRRVCRHYGWTRVAVVYSQDDFGSDTFFNFKTQQLDGDIERQFVVLAEQSFLKHQHSFTAEVAALRESGATVFLAFVSQATKLAEFFVYAFRGGLFQQGTQVLFVCHEPNVEVIKEVGKLLLPSESIDDVLKGFLSVHYYPEHHLRTADGQRFVTKFRDLPPTLVERNGVSHCNSDLANRTIASSHNYPLYKVKGYPSVCTGISNFSSLDQLTGDGIYPEALLTYDAIIALGKALHHLTESGPTAAFKLTNSSSNVDNELYNLLVLNHTFIKIIGSSGPLRWFSGYERANYYGQGDRISGHSFQLLNYYSADQIAASGVHVEDGMALVGYFNGTKDVAFSSTVLSTSGVEISEGEVVDTLDRVELCPVEGKTIDDNFCQAAFYRTGVDSRKPPSDMQPAIIVFSRPAMHKVVLAVVGALCICAAAFSLITLYFFQQHRLIKYTQPPLLACIFFGYLILGVKMAAGTSEIHPGYCVGDKWLAHVGFSAAFVPLVVKMWRLDKIVNGASLKRVKITDFDAFKVCIYCMLGLTLMLAVDSAVTHSDSHVGFMELRTALSHNQFTHAHFCGLSHSLTPMVLTAMVYVYQCVVLVVAILYLWKTRRLPAHINECGTIAPMILAVTVIVVVTATVVGVVDLHPYTNALVVNLAFALGILISLNYYWVPKISAIFREQFKKIAVATVETEKAVDPKQKWNVLKRNVTGGEEPAEETKSKEDVLLAKLHHHNLPLPKGNVQKNVVSELVEIRGNNQKCVFIHEQIGYLQTLIMALSEASDDSSNNSSSKATSAASRSIGVVGIAGARDNFNRQQESSYSGGDDMAPEGVRNKSAFDARYAPENPLPLQVNSDTETGDLTTTSGTSKIEV